MPGYYKAVVRGTRRLVGPAVLAGILAGCASHVRHGSGLYADGRYVEAAEVFEHTERRLHETDAREKAEYGTYRGLTLLVLGDLRNAHRWLAYAYEVERLHPGALRIRHREALDRGWQELGIRLRAAGTLPQPDRAVAAGPSPGAATPAPTLGDAAMRRSLVNH
jgi:hypothetical protein